jgi:glycine/D-amino acid oxidase-like deaminating enzyme
MMHQRKGLLWVAHTEAGVRAERARAEVRRRLRRADRARHAARDRRDLSADRPDRGSGVWPVLGASSRLDGACARHDRVVWALAEGAMRRGVEVHQRVGC